MPPQPPPPKRQRRSREEARRQILDVAEAHLAAQGPSALRLQAIAQEVGVSHPAILHHFGSRDGLVRAVVGRALERLEADLIATLGAVDLEDERAAENVIHRVHAVLVSGGYARLVVWLVLSGEAVQPVATRLRAVAEAAHARRVRRSPEGAASPPLKDTVFRALLVALVMFGDATMGDALRKSAGLDDTPEAGAEFRTWLVQLLTG